MQRNLVVKYTHPNNILQFQIWPIHPGKVRLKQGYHVKVPGYLPHTVSRVVGAFAPPSRAGQVRRPRVIQDSPLLYYRGPLAEKTSELLPLADHL